MSLPLPAVRRSLPISRPGPDRGPLPDAQAEANVLDALRSGRWGRLHDDSYAERFESAFAAYQDARHGIAVANGTVSLQLILRTLNIGIGDEVIVPALTFIATASAVAEVGAVPIFADVEAETLTIDPESVAAAITPRTRAIIGVTTVASRSTSTACCRLLTNMDCF